MRRALAGLLGSLLLRLYPEASYFDLDSDDRMTGAQWAAMMVLHAEAVHGCEHTEQARAELGMLGPRGEAVR